MHRSLLTGVIGAALAVTPLACAQQPQNSQHKAIQTRGESDGVQEAIAFQRAKDRADARQARLEARHPSVDYSNADRRMDASNDATNDSPRVPDHGPGKAAPPKQKK